MSSGYILIVEATAENGRREMNKLLTRNYVGHDFTSVCRLIYSLQRSKETEKFEVERHAAAAALFVGLCNFIR